MVEKNRNIHRTVYREMIVDYILVQMLLYDHSSLISIAKIEKTL